MGLSNKLATKIRTAGKSIPVSLPGHWDDNGMLIASAIVRGGAAVIGQLKLTSSGARGKDFLGIREARTKAPSTVWVEQLGLKEWCVSLGQATVAGPALDWQVRLKFSASATGDMAELTTPAMATRDGTLVNKRAHGELRDLLVTGLAQGRAPASGAERAVSDGGLSALTLPPFARIDTAKLLSAVIGTRLSGADLVGCLRLVPYAVLAADEDSIGWRLGEGEAMSGQIVTAVIQDAGSSRSIRLHCALTPTGRDFTDVLASQRAKALAETAFRLISTLDSEATRTDAVPADHYANEES